MKSARNKGCPIYYNNLDLSWLTLSLKLKDVRISGVCWGNSRSALTLKEISVGPGFPGIWPPGLKLNVSVKGRGSFVKMSFLWGIKKILYVKDSLLSSDILNTIIGQGNVLMGNVFLVGRVELGKNKVNGARLALQSKQLNLLPKTIRVGSLPFTLPAMKIDPIVIRGNLVSKKLGITSLRIGNPKGSSLFADFKGELFLDKKNGRVEEIDVQGELKIADELLSGPLSILNLLWNIGKKPNKEGVYRIKFSGPMGKALSKPEFL